MKINKIQKIPTLKSLIMNDPEAKLRISIRKAQENVEKTSRNEGRIIEECLQNSSLFF